MGLNRKIKAPKVFQGTPGKESRFAPSSRKQPKPKGTDPGKLGYGISPAPATNNPAGRAGRVTGMATSRDIPSGQGNLESKAKRQVC
jgi:hypothetical protein